MHRKCVTGAALSAIFQGTNNGPATIESSEALINATRTYILMRYLKEFKKVTEDTLAFKAVQHFMSLDADELSIASAENTEVLAKICKYAQDMNVAYTRLCETDEKYQRYASTCSGVSILLVFIATGLSFSAVLGLTGVCLASHALPLAITAIVFYSGFALSCTLGWYFGTALHSTAENRSLETLKFSNAQTNFDTDFFQAQWAILKDIDVSIAETFPKAYYPWDVFSGKNTPTMFHSFFTRCADNVNQQPAYLAQI